MPGGVPRCKPRPADALDSRLASESAREAQLLGRCCVRSTHVSPSARQTNGRPATPPMQGYQGISPEVPETSDMLEVLAGKSVNCA